MAQLPMKDVMNSVREMILFPQKDSKLSAAKGQGMFDNYPSDLASPLGINGGGTPGFRGSANLGLPTDGNSPSGGSGSPSSASGVNPPRFGSPGSSSSPGDSSSRGGTKSSPGGSSSPGGNPSSPGGLSVSSFGSPGTSSNPSGLPISPTSLSSGSKRPSGSGGPGSKDGTVYVNSLGQLSTEKDSGFDPKQSFILKPDADSTFDPLKGIDNSYSFGFPGESNTPSRGSEDLSEPVDPSAFGLDQFSSALNGQNPKQIYTYPHGAEAQNQQGLPGILPEYTGKLNTQLAAQGPSYQAPQVYGPLIPSGVASPQTAFQQPASPSGFERPNGQSLLTSPSNFRNPQSQQQNGFNRPSSNQGTAQQNSGTQPGNGQGPRFGNQQGSSQQPQKLYQQPSQQSARPNIGSQPQNGQETRFGTQPGGGPAQQPQRLYQQPNQQSATRQNYGNQPSNGQSQNFDNQQGSQHGNGQPNQYNSNSQQPQPFKARNQQADRRQFNLPQSNNNQQQSNVPTNYSNRNGQSNEEYLRNLLKDKTHIHHDKSQLVELIERLFVPPPSRVVSAEVIPSPARESYSFTYNEDSPSNLHNSYQQAPSGHHQHSGSCRHQY